MPEAYNTDEQEWSEENLNVLLRNFKADSAPETIEKIVGAIDDFAADAPHTTTLYYWSLNENKDAEN